MKFMETYQMTGLKAEKTIPVRVKCYTKVVTGVANEI